MNEAVYTYFVSFTYHWRDIDGTLKPTPRYGSLEVEMGVPIRRIEHVVEAQQKIKTVLSEQHANYIAQDVIVLFYQLLRFGEEGRRAVSSTASRGLSHRASKRLRNRQG